MVQWRVGRTESRLENISYGIKVLFEDNHILMTYKPAGILSQEDATGDPDMLTVLKEYLKIKYNKPGNVYLGLVHRLDRPVGGLMVFAKTTKAASRICEQIRNRTVEKYYRACVRGEIRPEKGTLKGTIVKDTSLNRARLTDNLTDKDGKEAELDYQLVAYRQSISLIEVHLKTGRAHQIRLQLSEAGFPIIGDRKYGEDQPGRGDICLESYKMAFNHPTSKERLTFVLPLNNQWPWQIFAEDEDIVKQGGFYD